MILSVMEKRKREKARLRRGREREIRKYRDEGGYQIEMDFSCRAPEEHKNTPRETKC